MSTLILKFAGRANQICGHTHDMEIIFELEFDDIIFEFTPERTGCYSDQTQVLWKLQHRTDQKPLDGMLQRNLTGEPCFSDPNTILRLFN